MPGLTINFLASVAGMSFPNSAKLNSLMQIVESRAVRLQTDGVEAVIEEIAAGNDGLKQELLAVAQQSNGKMVVPEVLAASLLAVLNNFQKSNECLQTDSIYYWQIAREAAMTYRVGQISERIARCREKGPRIGPTFRELIRQ